VAGASRKQLQVICSVHARVLGPCSCLAQRKVRGSSCCQGVGAVAVLALLPCACSVNLAQQARCRPLDLIKGWLLRVLRILDASTSLTQLIEPNEWVPVPLVLKDSPGGARGKPQAVPISEVFYK